MEIEQIVKKIERNYTEVDHKKISEFKSLLQNFVQKFDLSNLSSIAKELITDKYIIRAKEFAENEFNFNENEAKYYEEAFQNLRSEYKF